MTALVIPFSVPDGPRCAACNKAPTAAEIVESDYCCPGCGADLGHLDLTPGGMVRGVLGWLRSPGDVLAGRYRVRGFLGKGGLGATYLVEDQRLAGKRRAVKEIPELFFDERETEILARIQHPAVPDITDRFTADGMVYLVLEFGGERTLEKVREAEGGKIPLARLGPWIDQLCDVLAYLHAQRPPIVHRDLKPANVLLDEADRVMLIDFGIAKEAAPNTMTRTVARSASHGFSPPEQVMGTGTDERSDVYALGATLYVLLTGEIPPAAHERVAGAEVLPPRQLVPALSQAMEDAILCALELNVAHRHASIDDFRSALAEAQATPAPSRKGVAPRTVLLGDVPSTGAIAAHPTAAVAKADAGFAIPTLRSRGGISPAVLVVAVALLLASVGGAAWWLTRGSDEMAPKPPIATTPEPAPTPPDKGIVAAPPVKQPPPASEGPTTVMPTPPVETPPIRATLSQPSAPVPPPAEPSPPAPASPDVVMPAQPSGPSAFEELERIRPVQTELEPEAEPPVQTERDPEAEPPVSKPKKPKPAKKSAAAGWEGFQGPTRGYERKLE